MFFLFYEKKKNNLKWFNIRILLYFIFCVYFMEDLGDFMLYSIISYKYISCLLNN